MNNKKISIYDCSKIVIENYKNILEINTNKIKIDNYTILGVNLKIVKIDEYYIIICGHIEKILMDSDRL